MFKSDDSMVCEGIEDISWDSIPNKLNYLLIRDIVK